jgi:hypothetical protein
MSKPRPSFNFDTGPKPVGVVEPPEPSASEAKPKRYPTREGKRGVTFYVPPTAWEQLRMISIRERQSVQELMLDALDMLFTNKGYPRVAREPATEGADS